MSLTTLPGLPRARTRTESLRLQLEQDILSGLLKPGQKLDEEELAERFGMSRTPVREAIKALSSTGLLEVRQHQGAYVASLTLESIGEMIEVMSVIEVACAEMAARRHNAADRAAIAQARGDCEATLEPLDPAGFYAANVRFHDAIYSAAHNGYLLRQARALRVRLEPFRRQISYHEGSIQKSLREHTAIVEAIFAMDPEAARRAMGGHIAALASDIASLSAMLAR
ncbi:GntR family transcriptional regulator [Xylophilus sp. GOD-11R]|uniref:GntR family transcriptional regulator n=1 Tax=Xylophilus sp. GOD-11R TaxID=3089814 RepID=UPI00298D08E4|nr:GntR family transcriptional regulator [Xylophilus sp. GOD-11R]WPB56664.1 GntR family transcriptional regulator [Xylophilus sp. GOD-11R]